MVTEELAVRAEELRRKGRKWKEVGRELGIAPETSRRRSTNSGRSVGPC